MQTSQRRQSGVILVCRHNIFLKENIKHDSAKPDAAPCSPLAMPGLAAMKSGTNIFPVRLSG
jgi:hypothetical protein